MIDRLKTREVMISQTWQFGKAIDPFHINQDKDHRDVTQPMSKLYNQVLQINNLLVFMPSRQSI